MQYLVTTVRFLIGTVFFAALLSKVANRSAFHAFVTSLREMRVLPADWVHAIAWLMAAAEGCVVVLLAVPAPTATTLGLSGAAVLLVVFATGIRLGVRRGAQATCACFGVSSAPLGARHVARNATLAVLALAGAAVSASSPEMSWETAVPAALCGLVAAVLAIRLDDLFELFFPTAQPTR
ncbi:MauE/DoxX family redox-associated membrane protein [Streptomyces sp. NPDC005009]